jgi:murein DD-endopeptidase MepM/ murein hydrolase activator NlpD
MALAAPDPTAATGWQWPLRPTPNEVVDGFDLPDDRWSRGHRGVDLRGRAGADVRAAGAGVVTFAGLLAGRGVVTVTHGALRTTYEPVTPAVAVGDRVDAGAVIATLELIGGHCLPRACLHWGLVRGVTYLDPLSVVGAGPVRLLPLDAVPVPPGRSRFDPGRVDRFAAPAVSTRADTSQPRGSPRTDGAVVAAVMVLGAAVAGGTAMAMPSSRRRQ